MPMPNRRLNCSTRFGKPCGISGSPTWSNESRRDGVAVAHDGDNPMSLYRPLTLAAALALLAGCATIPKPLEGNYSTVSTSSAQQGGAGGTRVRWGGEIIKTEPGPQQTCFYLLSRPLDSQARPKVGNTGENQGRFVACRDGFYDPEVFVRGREVTVTGTLHGTVSQK